MASLGKRILKSAFVAGLASALIGLYIRLVFRTSRFDVIGWDHADPLLAGEKGFILAFWHQRLLMGAVMRRETQKPVYMLISAHRDGAIIANAVKAFGIELIRGSSANPKKKFKEKGGAPALAQMIAALGEGAIVGMTPDGPRGPSRKAQLGVVRLAELSGAPILAGAFSTSRALRLNTWDRFFLALPFSRGAFVVAGPAIPAPLRGADAAKLDAVRLEVEGALDRAADAADRLVGRSPDAREIG